MPTFTLPSINATREAAPSNQSHQNFYQKVSNFVRFTRDPLKSSKKGRLVRAGINTAAVVGSVSVVAPAVAATLGTTALTAAAYNPEKVLVATSAAIASIENPEIARRAGQAPLDFAKASLDAGKLSKNPTIAGVKEFVKKHPVYTSLIAGTAIYAAYQAEEKVRGVFQGDNKQEEVQTEERSTKKKKNKENESSPGYPTYEAPTYVTNIYATPPLQATQAEVLPTVPKAPTVKKKGKKRKKKSKKKSKKRKYKKRR